MVCFGSDVRTPSFCEPRKSRKGRGGGRRFWEEEEPGEEDGRRDALEEDGVSPSPVSACVGGPECHAVSDPATHELQPRLGILINKQRRIPQARGQSGDEPDVVHRDEPASLLGGRHLATAALGDVIREKQR